MLQLSNSSRSSRDQWVLSSCYAIFAQKYGQLWTVSQGDKIASYFVCTIIIIAFMTCQNLVYGYYLLRRCGVLARGVLLSSLVLFY